MTHDDAPEEEGNGRWRSIYVSVVAYTAVVIFLLWLFGRWFTG